MDSLDDIVRRLPPEVVTAATLERVFRGIRPEDGYAILSAHKAGDTLRKNAEMDCRLRHLLRSMGFGHITMKVRFDGDHGETNVPIHIIPGLRSDKALRLAVGFGQSFALWGDADGLYLLATNGLQERIADRPEPDNAARVFWRFTTDTDAVFRYLMYVPSGQIDGAVWTGVLRALADTLDR